LKRNFAILICRGKSDVAIVSDRSFTRAFHGPHGRAMQAGFHSLHLAPQLKARMKASTRRHMRNPARA